MGTNLRITRFGQNSSGKRPTRSITTSSVTSPTNQASPSTPRPGSSHTKHTTALRGGGRAPATAKRKSPPPSPARQPPPREEILAEIVVRTNGLDESDLEMSEDEAEMLGGAGPSIMPTTDAPKSVLETATSHSLQAKEPISQLLSAESVSADSRILEPVMTPKNTGFAKQQTTLPSSIKPSAYEDAVEERARQSGIDDDAKRMVSSKGDALLAQTPKEQASIEPAREESIPAEPEPSTSVTSQVRTETSERQAPQPDINDDAQVIPAGEVTHCSTPQSITTAGTASAKQISAEPQLDTLDAPIKTEFIRQRASQPQIENDVAQGIPATEEAMPNPAAQGLPTAKPTLDEFTPGDEINTPQAAMVYPGCHDTNGPKQTVEDISMDGHSKLDFPLEAGLSSETTASPGLGDRNTADGVSQSSVFAETLAEESRAIGPSQPRLTSSIAPTLSPSQKEVLPALETPSNGLSEGMGVAQSPPEQSEPMDLDLNDPVLTKTQVLLDLEDSARAFKLRRGLHSSNIPPLETLPSPTPSDTGRGPFGPMSNEDIERAFEDAAKVNAKMGETTTGATTTAPSAGDTSAGNGPSETHYSNEITSGALPSSYAAFSQQIPAKSTLKQIIGESRNSFASSSSLSALTDLSGLSSKPPSVSSKATTPFDAGSPRETLGHFTPGSTFQVRSSAPRLQFNVRPKVSIPADLTPQEYAMECIEAGENSRLNAYALHQEEYLMLRSHISHGQVTTYLNIRNGILRLWVRNPQIAVTREEAIGCAKDTRWFDVANICFDWLVRRGYINYGCVEIRQAKNHVNHTQPRKQKTVVVIGAGFSGLGCARQLEGLFKQYSKRFRDMGEDAPRVVILEGRNRVGGRVYSRAFETLPATAPGVMRGRRFTAEMGGMIITGFERGNPLNILVRGQLGLPYHCLLADMSLHDSNGTNVDLQRDTLVEQLYNACLDRVSEYKFKTQPTKLIEGNHDLMDEGRDSSAEGHKTIALVEETTAAQPHAPPITEQNVAPQVDRVPVSTNRMTGKVHTEPGTAGSTKAAFKAKQIGWTLKPGVNDTRDIDLDPAVNDPSSTLGSVLDNALMQHKDIVDLNAQDFRLFNWHIANLEYSNATNLNRLSSRGWDVDVGNEWDGRHTMVVGGYQSVARGLARLPAPLDIQHMAAVKRIRYAPDGSPGPARITLEDGKSVDADYVVNTIPLGVLKHGNVDFQPPLPSWKTQAIERLGFGVLNKVILVYKEAFWDKDRDIFGMLQTPTNRSSLHQRDYAARRGRFFQWFSVTNTTGMPCLLALMAGDAAYDTEITPNDELIAEATEVLRMRYGARVTQPLEAIVTRWESDRFARGSYSNAGVNMQPEDYQLMARTIGNLYFAGEHTTVTHPATVHGAYLSGLRAASDVLDAMLGPIDIPMPLVLPRETSASLKRKAQEEHKDPAHARLEAYEMEITEHIHATIGYYPLKPAKVAGNPYILFNKANYEVGRKKCEEGRRAGKGKPSPNEVRTMTSKMWKEASPEVRKPFEDAAEEQKRGFATALKEWTEAAQKWETEAMLLRARYMKDHPSMPGAEELAGGSNEVNGARRAKRLVESYREADSDVDMD